MNSAWRLAPSQLVMDLMLESCLCSHASVRLAMSACEWAEEEMRLPTPGMISSDGKALQGQDSNRAGRMCVAIKPHSGKNILANESVDRMLVQKSSLVHVEHLPVRHSCSTKILLTQLEKELSGGLEGWPELICQGASGFLR